MQTIAESSELAQKLLSETASVRLVPPSEDMSEEDNKPRLSTVPAANGKINVTEDDMSAALRGACDKYLAVAPKGTVLKKAKTPFIDEALLPDGQDPGAIENGVLGPHASSILMSLLYTARYARYDLLRPVCALASMVSRWNTHCDRMLYRLIC